MGLRSQADTSRERQSWKASASSSSSEDSKRSM
jgi:hypothetical protein